MGSLREVGGPLSSAFKIIAGRNTTVGNLRVRRILPRAPIRTVGPWCFVDHMGPVFAAGENVPEIAPHPHIGLQTVTWLLEGELVHRDGLGSDVVIRPGALNLMTAGRGVAHSEEATAGFRGQFHGVQLWVAQPSQSRDGPPQFEHHTTLPQLEVGNIAATILAGDFAGGSSPARRDSDLVGVDLLVHKGGTSVPLEPVREHALVVLEGELIVEGRLVVPGNLYFLGDGRGELGLSSSSDCHALLIGGLRFPEPILMWWNFVARTQEEIDLACADWQSRCGTRFAAVKSSLPPIEAPRPPWARRGSLD